jgi:hypothetical protein
MEAIPSTINKFATKLLNLLQVSEQRMNEGYKNTPIPNLKAHYNEARNLLQNINK